MAIEIPYNHVELYCEAFKNTGMALLCDFGGQEEWIPLSQIHDNSEVYDEGMAGDIIIPLWLAKERGLVE